VFNTIAQRLGEHKSIDIRSIIICAVVIVSLISVSLSSPNSSYATSFSSGVKVIPIQAAAGASAGGSGSSASAAASAGGITIVRNEPATINKNIIDSLVRGAEAKAVTTSPSSTSPLVDLETVKLGRSTFASNALRPLADVIPFRIIGGHVSLTSTKNVMLVAATITSRGIEHAVIIDLTKVRDVKAGESLFQTELGEVISGTNPFTKSHDTVSNFTDLLLWNNSNSPAIFSDDDQSTMTVIFR
jgi:hypothetical protein